jgi:hypothetical protein
MLGHNTQCDFEFPFGPLANQIERGKSPRAESMRKKTVTLDARFCQLTFTNQPSKGNFTDSPLALAGPWRRAATSADDLYINKFINQPTC